MNGTFHLEDIASVDYNITDFEFYDADYNGTVTIAVIEENEVFF